MQRFRHSSDLPGSVAHVIALITTREYLMYRYEQEDLHHLHIEISQNDEAGFACKVARSGSTHKLPGFVRKITGDAVTLVQEQHWSGRQSPVRGHLRLHIEGLPGHVHVDLTLRDTGENRCVLDADGQVVANIPLLGGRIEKLLISRAEEGFTKSAEAIREYVADHS